jgi:predicted RNase H-like nuclease
MGKYWPKLSPGDRRNQIYEVWKRILDLLERQIEGVATALRIPEMDAPRSKLKAYEDSLDAVICAWVATCALDGCIDQYGDEQSTIWIPTNRKLS